MTDLLQRFYGSAASLNQVFELARRCKNLDGDFVECGIAMGSGIAAMKRTAPEKRVWGYDSFQGIQLAGPKDTQQPGIGAIEHRVPEGGNLLISSGVTVHPREQVNQILTELGFKEEDFILVEGWVQETLPVMKPKKIAFLRLDMDLYDPTFYALRYLWPRLVNGGVLLIDDYQSCAGVKRACYDFLGERDWNTNSENPAWITKS